jgi:hypothetical protein
MPKFDNESEPKRISYSDANSGRRGSSAKQYAQDMERASQQEERAEVEKYEQGIAPARIYEPRCNVCNHAFRDWVEVMLVKGMPYKTLADRVNPPLERRSLSNHHKKHMDLQDMAFRAMLEREAKLQGMDVEEGIEDILTKRGVLEVMLRKGYEDVLNGIVTVEPRDLIQLTKVLADMDTQQHSVGLDELRAQVQIFIQAIKDVCPPEIQDAIGKRVKQLRQRENVAKPVEDIMKDPPESAGELVEASIVEEDESV